MKEEIVGVTGGMGFVGRSIVKKLLEDKWKVRCLVRKPEGSEDLKKQGIEIYKGDITNKSSIDESFFQDLSYLIHLVGIIKEVETQTLERVHFQGTKNLVDLAKNSGVKKFIHMSALGTRPDARSRYHSTKWMAEEYLRKNGLNHTIFRPSIIFGPDDEFINTFIRIIKLLLKVLNVERVLIPIPSFLMYPPAYLFQTVLRNPPLTLDQLIMLEEDNVCDMKEVQDIFSFSLLPLEEGLKQYLS